MGCYYYVLCLQQCVSVYRWLLAKSVDSLRHELAKIRTGRAHPSLLEHVHVEYYGSDVPLNQAANIAIEESKSDIVRNILFIKKNQSPETFNNKPQSSLPKDSGN